VLQAAGGDTRTSMGATVVGTTPDSDKARRALAAAMGIRQQVELVEVDLASLKKRALIRVGPDYSSRCSLSRSEFQA
jgi:hypothetical protein